MFTLTNILLFIVIVLLLVVIIGINHLASNLPKRPIETEIPTPYMAMLFDNHCAFEHARERLGRDFKGSAFPIKICVVPDTYPSPGSWTPRNIQVEFISALLEREGWVIKKDESCKPTEIIVDLPRKKF